jgi:predicted O-methyltransferase YrrM
MEMLEIGMTREVGALGDGYSTPFLAYISHMTDSSFTSVDVSKEHRDVCAGILEEYGLQYDAQLVVDDALHFLGEWNGPLDFLYLDAWDYLPGMEKSSAENHLKAFVLAEPWLKNGALILLDDILNHDTLEGKGKLIIPYMRSKGYELLLQRYQYLFRST